MKYGGWVRADGGGSRRSPQGERGLKSESIGLAMDKAILSLSARRAWIEIRCWYSLKFLRQTVALRKESVD